MIARRLICLFVVAMMAVAGCGANGGSTAGSSVSPSSTPTGSPLEFTATTVDGKPFDGRSLQGRPTALWFWAPWCPTCLMQAPGLRTAQQRSSGSVNIGGVAGLDEAGAMPDFVRIAKIEAVTNVSDSEGVIWKRFGVTEQSTLVLLDASGREVYRGKPSAAEIPERIAALAG